MSLLEKQRLEILLQKQLRRAIGGRLRKIEESLRRLRETKTGL